MIIQSQKYLPTRFYEKNLKGKGNPLKRVPNFLSTRKITYSCQNENTKNYLKKNENFIYSKNMINKNKMTLKKNSSFKSLKSNYRNLLTLKKSPLKMNFKDFENSKKGGSSVISKFNIKKIRSENEKKNLFFKIDLKKDIKKKSNNIQELRINNDFFKRECEIKNKEFLDKIKFNIKSKIFDKTVKSSLHFIYKHYENVKNKKSSNYFFKNNLEKQIENNLNSKKKLQNLKKENEIIEQKFLKNINNLGLIKKKKEFITDIKKESVLDKMQNLKRKNEILQKKISQKKNENNQEIFKIKCNYEKKGRDEMKKKAIILALNNCNNRNYDEFNISNKVKYLLQNINKNKKILKNLKYHKLLEKKEKLFQKLQNLKKSQIK